MSAILIALATSTAFILPVIIFMIVASIVAVKRGEGDTHAPHGAHATAGDAGAAAAVAGPPRELSVMEILLFATALFGIAMLALMGVSMLGHM